MRQNTYKLTSVGTYTEGSTCTVLHVSLWRDVIPRTLYHKLRDKWWVLYGSTHTVDDAHFGHTSFVLYAVSLGIGGVNFGCSLRGHCSTYGSISMVILTVMWVLEGVILF